MGLEAAIHFRNRYRSFNIAIVHRRMLRGFTTLPKLEITEIIVMVVNRFVCHWKTL